MPDFTFNTLDAIPEDMREGIKANDDGKFVVNLVLNTKLKEFRDNNVAISKERDEVKVVNEKLIKIVGDDVETFVSELGDLRSVAQKVKDGELTAKGDIAKTVEERVLKQVSEMKLSYESQLQTSAQETAKANDRAAKSDNKLKLQNIDRQITKAVLDEKSGARPDALPQILREAYDVFTVEDDGSLVPKNGEAIIYGADGTNPMTAVEWLAKQKEKTPFFFKTSEGGGAGGGKDTKVGNLSQDDFSKLPAKQRLTLIRRAEAAA